MRKMTTVSTSLFPVSASGIQIRLLYGYGNANENRSFFHYGNKQIPSLVVTHCLRANTMRIEAVNNHSLFRGRGEIACSCREIIWVVPFDFCSAAAKRSRDKKKDYITVLERICEEKFEQVRDLSRTIRDIHASVRIFKDRYNVIEAENFELKQRLERAEVKKSPLQKLFSHLLSESLARVRREHTSSAVHNAAHECYQWTISPNQCVATSAWKSWPVMGLFYIRMITVCVTLIHL